MNTGQILEFKNRKQMEKCFNMTVGQDGPTKTNSYNGPCLCNNEWSRWFRRFKHIGKDKADVNCSYGNWYCYS